MTSELKHKSFEIRNYPQEPVVFLKDVKEWLQQELDKSDEAYSLSPTMKVKWENAVLQKLLRELE
jgi:hypothetical protein